MNPRSGSFLRSWACASFALLLVTVFSAPSWAQAAEGAEGEAAAPYAPPAAVATEPPLGEVPACPGAPEGAYEGSDDAARELRALRLSQSEDCLTIRYLLTVLAERSWWGPAQVLSAEGTAHADVGPSLAELEAVASNTTPEEGGGSELVTVSNPSAIATPVAESVDASGESSRHALWFLCGAVVSLVAAYAIWRSGSIRG
jgi:hypothetical protein